MTRNYLPTTSHIITKLHIPTVKGMIFSFPSTLEAFFSSTFPHTQNCAVVRTFRRIINGASSTIKNTFPRFFFGIFWLGRKKDTHCVTWYIIISFKKKQLKCWISFWTIKWINRDFLSNLKRSDNASLSVRRFFSVKNFHVSFLFEKNQVVTK